jgi:hypothetical protein
VAIIQFTPGVCSGNHWNEYHLLSKLVEHIGRGSVAKAIRIVSGALRGGT